MSAKPDISPGIVSVMGHEPKIVLDQTSVGPYFRNEFEVRDAKATLKKHRGEQFAGLIGRRLSGVFTYDQYNLLRVLYVGGLRLSGNEGAAFTLCGDIPRRLQEPLAELELFLAQQQRTVKNLSGIDISPLPKSLREMIAQPNLGTTADLFPGIDIVFWQEPPAVSAPISRTSLGSRSGTNFTVHSLYPIEAYAYGSQQEADALTHMAQFRPFGRSQSF